jgi:hypothetical protein
MYLSNDKDIKIKKLPHINYFDHECLCVCVYIYILYMYMNSVI